VPPAEFIPLAEETGLIVDLGEWVLRDACRQAARWTAPTAGGDPLTVAVNLSQRQLEQPDLVGVVEAALADTGLAPRRLCLEITESAVMRDVQASIATLRRLKELGVRLAIDDFGVGFSSLSQLRHLAPVDMLKIDKSFVDNIAAGEDRAIVAAILSLAAALGLTTVAEGVEAPEQAVELSSLGCELAQGFLFARPQLPGALAGALEGAGPVPAA
jgi:EAL domain-containing protein (putative c-di-GMP-specific phosphodiesterase class I)